MDTAGQPEGAGLFLCLGATHQHRRDGTGTATVRNECLIYFALFFFREVGYFPTKSARALWPRRSSKRTDAVEGLSDPVSACERAAQHNYTRSSN